MKKKEIFLGACKKLNKYRREQCERNGFNEYHLSNDIEALIASHTHRTPDVALDAICSALTWAIICPVTGPPAEEWNSRSVLGGSFHAAYMAGRREGIRVGSSSTITRKQ